MGGQAYGPYYPGQDPSGSSSGSAVASALGLASGCLGTETDGSILSPASKNSIVGIKPTPGLTSRDLVIPISERQDTIGPMTRTVKDAAILLQAIAGVDPHDNYTSAIPNNGVIPDYVSACQLPALSGARIGISRNMMELRAVNTQIPAFEQAISVLKAAGATIIDNINFPSAAEFLDSGVKDLIIQADFPVNLASYLSQLTENPNNLTTLAEVREFTRSSNNEEFPGRDTALWDRILFEQGWDNTDPRFEDAYRRTLYYNGEGGLLGAIERHRLDAVIAPSDGTHTFAAGVGAPVITVPLGFSAPDAAVVKNSRDLVISGPNLPFGLSFMGAKFTEAKLIGLAYAFEQKTHIRDEGKMYISPKTELIDVIQR
ncbi:riboflavin kinase [Hypoxylon texense]